MSTLESSAGGARLPKLTVRRRRIFGVLLASTILALVLAVGSGSSVAWVGALILAGLTAGYLGLVHHSDRTAEEHHFSELSTSLSADLGSLPMDSKLRIPELYGQPVAAATRLAVHQSGGLWSLVRFYAAYAAGWALSPLVFAMTLLVGETPRDTTGQRWLAELRSAQSRLREQSMRTLAVSAAATASVTAAGSVAVLGGAAAGASPIRAAADVTSTVAVTAAAVPDAVPAAVPSTLAALQTQTYTVQNGDTLWAIAARFGTTVPALAEVNHIANPNLIYTGRVLAVPGRAPLSTVAIGISQSAAPSSSTRSTLTVSAGGKTYTVRAGDTLWAIAARFGTTVSAIVERNGLSNPNLIFQGQLLHIGGSGRAPAPVVTVSSPRTTPAPAPTRPAPAPAPTPASSSTQGAVAVATAMAQIGKPYQWAGSGPYSYDCSGLVMYSWAHAGVSLPHYSVAQYEDTVRISESELRPGDLAFYDTGSGAQPGHVTIYIGGGEVITADHPGTTVKIVPLTWDGTPMGFGRVR